MKVNSAQMDRFSELMGSAARDPHAIRQRIEIMEHLLEGMFVLPGIKRRIGLDSIIGLIPVIGDIVTAAMGAYIVWEARNLGMSKFHLARMAGNIGIDTLIGAVPFVGDAFDLLYRSNTKNLRIIRKHLDKHHPQTVVIEG
ncbi:MULTISPECIES: DUF4112 domain-containing protein [Novosphingopyxis]|uniref:DUF4112 domain-containing protein n=1 Tax=Novosphingopyxis TaxID=2709686 RepID=UPI001651A20D|nr:MULTISPECIES: DUF4112 domain-containing protein [Novosphingopyxis]MBH9538627.1 DUF4112 domain-containing protein [Novosphingopyxis sp. YJ-S2-01]|tara:strand:+ start:60 stop:482 length:423 start_codon:yes stop_codon:yes gene_type:complete